VLKQAGTVVCLPCGDASNSLDLKLCLGVHAAFHMDLPSLELELAKRESGGGAFDVLLLHA
jgi:hypothetical protein